MSKRSALATRPPGIWTRILRALRLVEVRDDGSTSFDGGAEWAADYPASRPYSALSSMSATAAFPWVQACMNQISQSMSGLPLKVIKGRGADAEVLTDHPILDLLDRPSTRTPGILFRRQLITDLVLSGDCYAVIGTVGTTPAALLRLHPEYVRIIGDRDTQPSRYVYTGGGQSTEYGPDQIMHVSLPSWATGPKSLYGTGAIEALNADLMTDKRAAELAAETAKTGRPTSLISPSSSEDVWSDQQVKSIRRAWEAQLKGTSGALILGSGGVNVEMLSHSPRDMEFSKVRELAREAVMGAMGVPPSMVSLSTANYAQSVTQQRIFWASLESRAAMLDHGYTMVARMFDDSDDVRVVHDFSAVEALQESRSERQQRVQNWWMMGVPLAEAAALEGFDDLDVEEAPPQAEEPTEDRSLDTVARWLAPGPVLVTKAIENKGEIWRQFIDELHSPTERRRAPLMTRYRRDYGRQGAKRAGEVLKGAHAPVTRALTDSQLDRILDTAAQEAEVMGIMRPTMRKAIESSMQQVASVVPVAMTFQAVDVDGMATKQIASMVQNITTSTRTRINAKLVKMIQEEASLSELQAAIQSISKDYSFTAARALTIARTETTSALSGGRQVAMEQAVDLGVEMQKEWITAGDEVVRDAHAALGSSGPIPVSAPFVADGSEAMQPGQFGVAALDINCRCDVFPVVKA